MHIQFRSCNFYRQVWGPQEDMKLRDMKMKCVEVLGLTVDWNLDCSPKKSLVMETSAWLPQAFFFSPVSCSPFPVHLLCFFCCVGIWIFIFTIKILPFPEWRSTLWEWMKKVDAGSTTLSVSRIPPILEQSLNILSET